MNAIQDVYHANVDSVIQKENIWQLKEEREYNIIEEKHVCKADQKKIWEAGYPWIKDPRTLPDNKSAAFTALKVTERHLSKDLVHTTVYRKQIESMVQSSVARKLTEKETKDYELPIFFRIPPWSS